MKFKTALYVGLAACALLILVNGSQGQLLNGIVIGLCTLAGTMLYARGRSREFD